METILQNLQDLPVVYKAIIFFASMASMILICAGIGYAIYQMYMNDEDKTAEL